MTPDIGRTHQNNDLATLLSDLAGHCEKATEPSRDLDLSIMRYVMNIGGPPETADHYTASLDAAMTLVPDGIGDGTTEEIKVERWGGNGVYAPHVRASAWVMGARRTFAATMPLALCAAALRARAAIAQNRSGE